MPEPLQVREASPQVRIIDIGGEITTASEQLLLDAYALADVEGVTAVVLNFTELEYMNSGGIGLLVMLLVRAQRAQRRLLAYGLSDHYRQILDLTRLDEAIAVHDSEAAAVQAAAG